MSRSVARPIVIWRVRKRTTRWRFIIYDHVNNVNNVNRLFCIYVSFVFDHDITCMVRFCSSLSNGNYIDLATKVMKTWIVQLGNFNCIN